MHTESESQGATPGMKNEGGEEQGNRGGAERAEGLLETFEFIPRGTRFRYRPNWSDSWGWIYAEAPSTRMIAQARSLECQTEEDYDRHRRDGTDPYEQLGLAITRMPELRDALVDALARVAELEAKVAAMEEEAAENHAGAYDQGLEEGEKRILAMPVRFEGGDNDSIGSLFVDVEEGDPSVGLSGWKGLFLKLDPRFILIDRREFPGLAMLFDERDRQVVDEGFDECHDEAHTNDQLLRAAECYLSQAFLPIWVEPPAGWPWDASWWKPTTKIRDLSKAGALIAAEIDRVKRAEARTQPGPEGGARA